MPGGPAVAVHLAASGTLEVTQRGGVIARRATHTGLCACASNAFEIDIDLGRRTLTGPGPPVGPGA